MSSETPRVGRQAGDVGPEAAGVLAKAETAGDRGAVSQRRSFGEQDSITHRFRGRVWEHSQLQPYPQLLRAAWEKNELRY